MAETLSRIINRRAIGVTCSALLLVLFAATVLVRALRVPEADRRLVSTQVQWRGIQQWRIGWRKTAYCSEQAAAFRGWTANLGPMEIIHLKSTHPIPLAASPTNSAGANQNLELSTNQPLSNP